MAEVTINYKDAAIATMDASGTKTLQTQGKYCEDDIEVVYARPSAPSGTKQISITQNGTTVEDVAAYASAEISVNVQGGGGDEIYYTKYTLTGDTNLYNFLQSAQYSPHYSAALIRLRANGDVAPATGSYTLNNITMIFNGGNTSISQTQYYTNGRTVPNNAPLLYANENLGGPLRLVDGVLSGGTASSTSCLGTTGDNVVIVEIPFDVDKYKGVAE